MSEEFNEWCPLKHDCDYREGAWDAWQVQQARIDELMLEYCPNEMTADQIEKVYG